MTEVIGYLPPFGGIMTDVILYSLTAGCLFFLAFSVIAMPGRSNIKARYWLSLFLFSFACAILDHVLFDIKWYLKFPGWQGVLEITRFAMAPALYFSIVYFTVPSRQYRPHDLLHFIPFALFAGYMVLIVAGLHVSNAFDWFYQLPDEFRRILGLTVFLSLKIQMIAYWIISFRTLTLHKQNIKKIASTIEPVSLAWLFNFLIGLLGALFLSLNAVLAIIPSLIPLTAFCYLLLTFYFGYFSLQQKEIFPYSPQEIATLERIVSNDFVEGRLSGDEIEKGRIKLLELMQEKKLFLDPDLGLPGLATIAGMTTHEVSYVLNKGMGENFYQFVNRFRVEEAKTLLVSEKHKHLNILGIAFESGFRSKTTFNTTFKKMTGMSPSAYAESGRGAA